MKYIFIALTLFACNTVDKKNAARKVSTEVLDTIKAPPAGNVVTPILFETAFIKGTTQKIENNIFRLYGVTVGKIKISSGKIIACDPLHIDEYGIPFTQVFPTGEFPLQFSIAQFDDVETIAFARISFSEEPVVRWELALQKGQEPLPVGGEEIHGYGVDGGVGIVMDAEAVKSLDLEALTDMDTELYKEMDKHYHNTWRYAMYNAGTLNVVCFTTGLGDGRYQSYIGYDASGMPCRLLTDFRLFDWRKK